MCYRFPRLTQWRVLLAMVASITVLAIPNCEAQTLSDTIGCSFRGSQINFKFNRPLELGREMGRYGGGLFDCQFWVVEGVTLTRIDPLPIQAQAMLKPEGSSQSLTLQPYYANGAMLITSRSLPSGVRARNFANTQQGFSTNFSTGLSEWIDPDFRPELSLQLPLTLEAGDRVQKVVNNFLPNPQGVLQPIATDSAGDSPLFLMNALLTVVSSAHIPEFDALAPAVVGPASLTNHTISLQSVDRWLRSSIAMLWSTNDYQNRVRNLMGYGERLMADNIRSAFIHPVKFPSPHWTDSQTIPLSMGINSPTFTRSVSYGREFASAAGEAYIAALFRSDLNHSERLALLARLVQLAIQEAGVWHYSYQLGVRSQNMLLGGKAQGPGLNMVLAGLITGIPDLAGIYILHPDMSIAEAQIGAQNAHGVWCGRRVPDTIQQNFDCDFTTAQLPVAQDAHYPRDTLRSVSALFVVIEATGRGQLLPDSFRRIITKFIDQSLSVVTSHTKPTAEVADYWWLVKRLAVGLPSW